MDLADKVTASGNVVAREVGGEFVLLHLQSGTYFGLNDVGGRVWNLVEEQPRSIDDVCEALALEFDVERSTLNDDILGLAHRMVENGLLEKA